MQSVENQNIENTPEPKSAVEIISEKNSIINDLQNEVALLKKGVEEMHVKIADVTVKYETTRKLYNTSIDNYAKLKSAFDCAQEMYDTLLDKLIGKI